jgi:hypothetical protein
MAGTLGLLYWTVSTDGTKLVLLKEIVWNKNLTLNTEKLWL